MKKLKIMTVVGTRPEIIRLSEVIRKLNNTNAIEHVLVHTGQNYDYELNEVFFNDLNIKKPNYFLNAASGKAVETIGNILLKIDPILETEKPDVFLVLGDTNSCLSAIAAKRKHIPIFHMEAGNRCFDSRVPEETNRKIVDHLADINLPYSSIARGYLISEGFPSDRIIKTGSPMFEVLSRHLENIEKSNILEQLKLEKGQYFVISTHREENIDTNNFIEFVDTLNSIAEIYKLPIILSAHPRTWKAIEQKSIKFNKMVRISKPLGFLDYIKLQKESKAVLSDSGTISEESSILKFKALNIREAHERPEAMEEGAVMMVGMKKDRILQALSILFEQSNDNFNYVQDYMVDNVSTKVVRIILSYTNYVNLHVWMKKN